MKSLSVSANAGALTLAGIGDGKRKMNDNFKGMSDEILLNQYLAAYDNLTQDTDQLLTILEECIERGICDEWGNLKNDKSA